MSRHRDNVSRRSSALEPVRAAAAIVLLAFAVYTLAHGRGLEALLVAFLAWLAWPGTRKTDQTREGGS